MSVAFSPDGATIVSGSADQTIKVWGVRPVLDSEWEEVDISEMEKDDDGEVEIEGLGYIGTNYWKSIVTGDLEKQKPSGGESLRLELRPSKSGVQVSPLTPPNHCPISNHPPASGSNSGANRQQRERPQ